MKANLILSVRRMEQVGVRPMTFLQLQARTSRKGMLKKKDRSQPSPSAVLPRVLPVDVLVGVNLLISALWAILFYYPRFLSLHSTGNPAEFLFYAGITMAATFVLWRKVRRLGLGWKTVAPLQVLLLLHMLGGITSSHGIRLYDCHLLFGLTYDKVVHAYAGFAAALVFATVMSRSLPRQLPFANLISVLVVMGVSALWELVEYAAYTLIPLSGVGSYDNNMTDMLANLLGAILFVAQPERWREAQTAPDSRKALPHPSSRLEESNN